MKYFQPEDHPMRFLDHHQHHHCYHHHHRYRHHRTSHAAEDASLAYWPCFFIIDVSYYLLLLKPSLRPMIKDARAVRRSQQKITDSKIPRFQDSKPFSIPQLCQKMKGLLRSVNYHFDALTEKKMSRICLNSHVIKCECIFIDILSLLKPTLRP